MNEPTAATSDSATSDYATLTRNGLWRNNPALVQLLGLCPLLAVTTSVVNSLGLALATLFVLVAANVSVSMVRRVVPDTIRLPVFVLIIATAVTVTELLMQAYAYRLYQVLGIFLPLITTNCVILGRADSFAARNPPLPAAYDGLMMGLGFAVVLLALGAIRELLGSGTLLADMDLLFGPVAKDWQLTLVADQEALLLAVLPPGAFIVMGLLIAGKNLIDQRRASRLAATREAPAVGSKRVRVTGHIS